MTTPIASEPERLVDELMTLADDYALRFHGAAKYGGTPEKERSYLRFALESALSSRSGSAAETAGWRLVPVEATQAMIVHGSGSIFLKTGKEISLTDDEVREAYRAMLSAAPQPPSTSTPDGNTWTLKDDEGPNV